MGRLVKGRLRGVGWVLSFKQRRRRDGGLETHPMLATLAMLRVRVQWISLHREEKREQGASP